MKKIKLLIPALFLSVFIFNSCDNTEELIGSMSATIDGEETSLTAIGVQNSLGFVITGTAISKEVLAVTIKGDSEGAYELSILPAKAQCAGVYKENAAAKDTDSYISKTGSVEITDINTSTKRISGDFSFVMAKAALAIPDTIKVENGVFKNIKYTAQ